MFLKAIMGPGSPVLRGLTARGCGQTSINSQSNLNRSLMTLNFQLPRVYPETSGGFLSNTPQIQVSRNLFSLRLTVITQQASFLGPKTPLLCLVNGFKDMDVLRKRCKDCYFKKLDNRWYVLCPTHGRHKQRQRIGDIRDRWIITHSTQGVKKF